MLLLAGVIHTRLTKHLLGEGLLKGVVGLVGSPWLKSPAQGAATSITAALDPSLESQSGTPSPPLIRLHQVHVVVTHALAQEPRAGRRHLHHRGPGPLESQSGKPSFPLNRLHQFHCMHVTGKRTCLTVAVSCKPAGDHIIGKSVIWNTISCKLDDRSWKLACRGVPAGLPGAGAVRGGPGHGGGQGALAGDGAASGRR